VFALLALAAAACGGGGGSGGGSALSSNTAAIMSCLKTAGLSPKKNAALPLGVDDPVQGIKVPLQSQDFNESYQAEIWVFESGAAATKNRPAITLQTHDDVRNKVVGPVVVDFSIVPDKQDAQQVESCL